MDIQLERMKFENDMIYKKLQKEAHKRHGRSINLRTKVENANDVDLNFNTKVNFVEFLQRRIIGKFLIPRNEERYENLQLRRSATQCRRND